MNGLNTFKPELSLMSTDTFLSYPNGYKPTTRAGPNAIFYTHLGEIAPQTEIEHVLCGLSQNYQHF